MLTIFDILWWLYKRLSLLMYVITLQIVIKCSHGNHDIILFDLCTLIEFIDLGRLFSWYMWHITFCGNESSWSSVQTVDWPLPSCWVRFYSTFNSCMLPHWMIYFATHRIIHLIFTLVFHFLILRQVEKYLGWFPTSVIYIGSGIGGNLVSIVFIPYNPEVC